MAFVHTQRVLKSLNLRNLAKSRNHEWTELATARHLRIGFFFFFNFFYDTVLTPGRFELWFHWTGFIYISGHSGLHSLDW